jgi:hypothetical protein
MRKKVPGEVVCGQVKDLDVLIKAGRACIGRASVFMKNLYQKYLNY